MVCASRAKVILRNQRHHKPALSDFPKVVTNIYPIIKRSHKDTHVAYRWSSSTLRNRCEHEVTLFLTAHSSLFMSDRSAILLASQTATYVRRYVIRYLIIEIPGWSVSNFGSLQHSSRVFRRNLRLPGNTCRPNSRTSRTIAYEIDGTEHIDAINTKFSVQEQQHVSVSAHVS